MSARLRGMLRAPSRQRRNPGRMRAAHLPSQTLWRPSQVLPPGRSIQAASGVVRVGLQTVLQTNPLTPGRTGPHGRGPVPAPFRTRRHGRGWIRSRQHREDRSSEPSVACQCRTSAEIRSQIGLSVPKRQIQFPFRPHLNSYILAARWLNENNSLFRQES